MSNNQKLLGLKKSARKQPRSSKKSPSLKTPSSKKPPPTKKSTKKTESNKEAYKRIQGENTKVLKGMIDEAFKGDK